MFAAVKHLFKLQFLIILIAAFAGIYYQEILEKLKSMIVELADDAPVSVNIGTNNQKTIFTKNVLAQFTGAIDDQPIYLSILGSVYDVTKGKKHYGRGCSYNYFAGRDASKSFISGEFEVFDEDSDDVMTLSPSEILSLYEWKKFYDKEYTFKGLAEGRFYNKKGMKTKYHYQLDAIADQALEAKLNEDQQLEIYPQCNIEWNEETGTRVWCTNQSGGKKRDWIGVPRKYYELKKNTYRCACIKESELDAPHIQPYENCDLLSPTCFYQVN